MKSKNYLVRTNQFFILSRGNEFECEIQGLALVHLKESSYNGLLRESKVEDL